MKERLFPKGMQYLLIIVFRDQLIKHYWHIFEEKNLLFFLLSTKLISYISFSFLLNMLVDSLLEFPWNLSNLLVCSCSKKDFWNPIKKQNANFKLASPRFFCHYMCCRHHCPFYNAMFSSLSDWAAWESSCTSNIKY